MKYCLPLSIILAFYGVGQAQEHRTVSVSGMSKTLVEPDIASMEFGALVRGADLSSVKEESNRKIGAIVEALKDFPLEEDAIRTSQVDLSINIRRESGAEEVPMYEMYRQVNIRLDDLSLLGAVIDGCISAGANQISGIHYSTAREPELREELLLAAIIDAKEQAQRLAIGFEAKLGKAVKIVSDSGGTVRALSLVVSTTSDPFGGDTYRPGRIELKRSVDVVFELTD